MQIWQLKITNGPESDQQFMSTRAVGTCSRIYIYIFFFLLEETPPSESALYGFRWASKTSAVSSSYKRCTPKLELETCCADLKPFVITLRPFGDTIEYIDPKYYVLLNVLTAKGDVYGLGVVLLELLTGKRAEFKNDEDCT
jgi:hypothetical protein